MDKYRDKISWNNELKELRDKKGREENRLDTSVNTTSNQIINRNIKSTGQSTRGKTPILKKLKTGG